MRLLNVYSCSETHEVAAGDLGELVENAESTYCAVGAPMDPEHLYLLDADGERVPEGEQAGELFVGGECLARGYVELPEKTEESFPEDPFSSKNGAKRYIARATGAPHPLRREPGDPRPRGLYGQDPRAASSWAPSRPPSKRAPRRKILRRGLRR